MITNAHALVYLDSDKIVSDTTRTVGQQRLKYRLGKSYDCRRLEKNACMKNG